MSRRPKILFHVESLWGVGHAVRALRLVSALNEFFDCTIVSGSYAFPAFPLPPGVAFHRLPELHYSPNCQHLLSDLPHSIEELLHARALSVLRTFSNVAPDLVLIEMFPFGRHALRDELLLLMEAAARCSIPSVISLRDICIYPSDPEGGATYAELISMVLREYRPLVLVHSDPNVQSLDAAIPVAFRAGLEDTKFLQVGYIGRGGAVERKSNAAVIRFSCGGGRRGAEALERSARLASEIAGAQRSEFIVGLHTPRTTRARITASLGKEVRPVAFRGERAFETLEDVAGWVVSGGYNTWMDILATRVPTLVIPLDEEQALRTRALRRVCPWVRSVAPDVPDPMWLHAWEETQSALPQALARPVTEGGSIAGRLLKERYA